MIQAIFQFLMNFLATVIQLIAIPINTVVESTMPSLDIYVTIITTELGKMFTPMYWALGLIPNNLLNILTFILTLEIAKHTIFASTHGLIKVWNLFQKIKFW